jgi:hypothetical protein
MDSHGRLKTAWNAALSQDEKIELRASRRRAVEQVLVEAHMLLAEAERTSSSPPTTDRQSGFKATPHKGRTATG